MPLSGSILSLKDPNTLGQGFQPLLLADLTFADGSTLHVSTHNLNNQEGGNTYNGISYLARIDQQDIASIQARSEQGIDRISDVTLHLFNADGYLYDNFEIAPGRGFKGAFLALSLVLLDIDPGTGLYVFTNDSPAPMKFSGICDAANGENGGQMLTIRATTSHNLARVVFPSIPCQQRCVNPFPGTAKQRKDGASDLASQFYSCGYCPDQAATDPVTGQSATRGNIGTPNLPDPANPQRFITDAAGVYISCNYTKTDCIARGMWDKDSAARLTRRYTGIQWSPTGSLGNTYSHSVKYGSGSVAVFSARNDSIYTRNYPYVFGKQWVKAPLICNVLGDANSTRMEVVIDSGDISDFTDPATGKLVHCVDTVLVNGVIIPHIGDTYTTTVDHIGPTPISPITILHTPSSELFRWDLIATGSRTGNFTLDAGYNGAGDPYGSLGMIEVVVFAELAASSSTPDVRVLLTGHKIKTPNTANAIDEPNWPYVHTNLPPWILLDLLIEGNYTYAEIDLQSFIDAANFCGLSFGGNNLSYIALDGTTRHHNRFIAEGALEEKRTGQEVIQSLLRSFNAQLIPNSETGLLSLFIRRTLADQQPTLDSVKGTNYTQPVQSLHANSDPGVGYVAYLIDESVIQQDGKGVPKIRGPYCNATAQSPNRITFPFQDADNVYQDDSISVVDTADVARAGGYLAGGQLVPQSLPVIGISSFDQGIRIANVALAENFRFNENRDSRGTRRWDIEATSRLEHLKVGQIVILQYQAINSNGFPSGLGPLAPLQSPPPAIIPGILARVETIKPTTNYERVTITLAFHEDYVYTDAYGQHAAPPASDPGSVLVRKPYAWDPHGEQPLTSVIWDLSAFSFSAAQTYSLAKDGSALASLAIGGRAPVNIFGTLQPPTFESSQASQSPTGGTIPGRGQTVYCAISARDANNKWSKLSKWCSATMPSGGPDTNTFTTPPIFWDSNTAAYAIFAGISDNHWTSVGGGVGTPATVTFSFLNVATYGPPDPLADSLVFQTKLLIHGGDWGDQATTVGANSLTFTACNATPNQFKGQILSLYANPQGSTANVPIADFLVTGNTATVFSVLPDPLSLLDSHGNPIIVAGMVFVMRSKYSSTPTVLTNPNWVNSYAPSGLAPGAEVGNLVRILAGTGVGQPPRQITANDATTITVDPPWDFLPDASSIIIIEEPRWHAPQTAKQSASNINPPAATVGKVSIDNFNQLSVLVEVLVADAQGNTSIERFSPLREIYIWGGAGSIGNAGVTIHTNPVVY